MRTRVTHLDGRGLQGDLLRQRGQQPPGHGDRQRQVQSPVTLADLDPEHARPLGIRDYADRVGILRRVE